MPNSKPGSTGTRLRSITALSLSMEPKTGAGRSEYTPDELDAAFDGDPNVLG
jgi:hypothetical protein